MACQLGTTMELWLKKHGVDISIVSVDNNNQAIELLKSDHVDAVFMDATQAGVFAQKNPGLGHSAVVKADQGYGIALKKGSALTEKFNQAIAKLQANGEIQKLKEKWIGGLK